MPIQPGLELKKSLILEKVTQEQIFEKYLGYEIDTESNFLNPLRPDRKASCRFYYNSEGKLYFHDFGKFHWDCFAVVQYRYGLKFIEALRKIVEDFTLVEVDVQFVNEKPLIVKERIDIQVAVRDWTREDLKFWERGCISEEILRNGNVYPLKAFWVNKEYFKCWKSDPTYCYYFGNGLYKIYFPSRKEGRFFQNLNQSVDNITQGYYGLPRTGDHLIITKSYKDVLSMRAFNIIADAVISETHLLLPERIEEYKKRFTHIYTLFDNDQTGRRLAIKYWKTYNIPYLMFPKGWGKDFFDNASIFGRYHMAEIVEEIQKKLVV